MKNKLESIQKARLFLMDLVKDLSISQLNEIPPGFNNNIIWNFGHLVAAQQGICYLRSGLKLIITEEFFNDFKPGSKPERYFSEVEFENIKKLLSSTLEQFETDYNGSIFQNYSPVTTRYGIEFTNVDDALNFIPFHDGIHCGYVMALKRVLTSQRSDE